MVNYLRSRQRRSSAQRQEKAAARAALAALNGEALVPGTPQAGSGDEPPRSPASVPPPRPTQPQ